MVVKKRIAILVGLSVACFVNCRPNTRNQALDSEVTRHSEAEVDGEISKNVREFESLEQGLLNPKITSFYIAPNREGEESTKENYRSRLVACEYKESIIHIEEYIVRQATTFTGKLTGTPFVSLCRTREKTKSGKIINYFSVKHGSGGNEIARMQWKVKAVMDNGKVTRYDLAFEIIEDPKAVDTSESDIATGDLYAEIFPQTATFAQAVNAINLRELTYSVDPRVTWKEKLSEAGWDFDLVFAKKLDVAAYLDGYYLYPTRKNIHDSYLPKDLKKILWNNEKLMESVDTIVPFLKLRKVTDFQKLPIPRAVLILLGAIPYIPLPKTKP